MKNGFAILILVATAFLTSTPAAAQTCSCAAVPILGTMQSASPKDKQWYLASTYQYNDLSDLVSGSDSIPDATGRDRTSQALIVEISRGITEKWSASALFSAVDHHREVSGISADASGIGDAVFMVKYSPTTISLYSDTTWSFGLGVRAPLGVDDAMQGGIVLAEDMQPSTGAYGLIGWAFWSKAFTDSRSTRIYVSASHTQNGENSRDYEFGQDTTLSVGAAHQTQSPWGFNLELFYRQAERDQRDSVEIPNTGGEWLDIIPAVQYHLSETLALKASAKFPVSRDLNDQIQFTTKYAYRLSLSYVFGG
ncbi:MAG: hypothetical protein ACR2QL_09180 [Woeseiaceae bacterium]